MGGDIWVSMEVKAFLQAARPDWKRSQVNLVKSKLARVGIGDVAKLVEVLQTGDGTGLNELLYAHDEKALTEETLAALREQSAKPLPVPQMPNLEDQELSPASQAVALEAAPVLPVVAAFKEPISAREKSRGFAPPARSVESALSRQPQEEDLHPSNTGIVRAEASSAPAEIDPELQRRINKLKAVAPIHGLSLEAAEGMARKEYAFEQQQKQDFLARYKPKAKASSRSGGAATLAALHHFGDCVWFCVKFSKVFVKKAPNEKAKSWGFIFTGQKIQVLAQSARDDSGRLWVELTLFELWRSCLQGEFHRPFESLGPDERRAFCLIDGSDMKLGTLLEGPLPLAEWPEISTQEWHEYLRWSGEMSRAERRPKAESPASERVSERTTVETESVRHFSSAASSSSERVQRPPSSASSSTESAMPPLAAKSAMQFQILDELQVHARPSLDSLVLGTKAAGERVYAHEEVVHGWVQLAGEPGWVLFDAGMDEDEESQSRREHALKQGVSTVVKNWSNYKSPIQRNDLTVEARMNLRTMLVECEDNPEVPLYDLEVRVRRAIAFGVERELIEIAEQKVAQLQKEGSRGRWARRMRDLLEQAKTEKEFRSVIQQCTERNILEVAEEGDMLLQSFLADQASAQNAYSAVLDYLVAAIATGDKAAIKEARDTAKAAGVPKKELARAFALAHDIGSF